MSRLLRHPMAVVGRPHPRGGGRGQRGGAAAGAVGPDQAELRQAAAAAPGSLAARPPSCWGPTTSAATSSRACSTAAASRWPWRRAPSCWRRAWAWRWGWPPACSAAGWTTSSCAWPTSSWPFPVIMLAIAIVAVVGTSPGALVGVLALLGLGALRADGPGQRPDDPPARLRRSRPHAGRQRPPRRPPAHPPEHAGAILVMGSSQFATMVLLESGLSFLGLGIQPPQPSWGAMLAEGRDYLPTPGGWRRCPGSRSRWSSSEPTSSATASATSSIRACASSSSRPSRPSNPTNV